MHWFLLYIYDYITGTTVQDNINTMMSENRQYIAQLEFDLEDLQEEKIGRGSGTRIQQEHEEFLMKQIRYLNELNFILTRTKYTAYAHVTLDAISDMIQHMETTKFNIDDELKLRMSQDVIEAILPIRVEDVEMPDAPHLVPIPMSMDPA